ncbi:MAG: DNA replication/repair protein RecF [Bacteriovoracaceae bacterium]|nr:DNA replication/repair protein RecF [Bacteriovoracaceae bacterium]
MYRFCIEKLQVTNFRNLYPDIVDFSSGINCIFGENGNGKTNILEAIYVMIYRKSFRKNSNFSQFLSIDSEQSEILLSSILSKSDDDRYSYSAKIKSDSSFWYINDMQTKKRLDIAAVFINPFDSYNFFNSNAFRRKWFDDHIGNLDIDYKKTLKKYNMSLRFRNTLLSRKPTKYEEQICAIDLQLAKYSVSIIRKRKKFLNDIKEHCRKSFKQIFSEEHELEIYMDTKFADNTEAQIAEIMRSNIEKDKILGHTSLGVHKDDYLPHFDGLSSLDYCSLGQQKMSYLSLLFAYIELFRYNFNTYPIVLIDDVSGELDKYRWRNLIDYLKKCDFQVLITTANEGFGKELEKIDNAVKICVNSGKIDRI